MKKYIKSASSVELTDQQIKEAISKHVLHMQDHAAENAIRKILFSDENIINWQNAWAAVKYNMPEMTKYRPESVEGASLPSDEDDFGPGEHIPIPIEKVKKGDFFKLSDKPNGKVYVKDDYDKSERAYWCYEYYDVNSGRYFKKGKTVYTGFTF